MNKFYLTTSIFYTNGKPHIGHAYEALTSDAIARWHRLKGEDTFFLSGTDEHGVKIQKTADKSGKAVKDFVEELIPHFTRLLSVLNISNDDFIRTSEERHKKVAQRLFSLADKAGDIYKGEYTGLYCEGCEAFYTEKELDDGVCPVHKTECTELAEETYFFKMGKYQQQLIKHIEEHPEFILPQSRRNEILSRLKSDDLHDLSVTRKNLKWGITCPIDPEHVIYVWFDALINYISGVEELQRWPADVHIIGKDILWFHTVIWPTMLMSINMPLPKTIFAHGFINLGQEKLSKSRGIIIDPFELVDTYGADAVRYYLMKEAPYGEDIPFTHDAFIARINGELVNDLGNLIRRVQVMLDKHGGKIPSPHEFTASDLALQEKCKLTSAVDDHMKKFELHRALETVWQFIRACNKYLSAEEPWKVQDEQRLDTILYTLAESARIISIFIEPFMPQTAVSIRKGFNFPETMSIADADFLTNTTGQVQGDLKLFTKIEVKKEAPQSLEFPLDIRVAHIDSVTEIPESEKLYKLQITIDSTGTKRQLVAGLKQFYAASDLQGKNVLYLHNLKPAKLMGIESQGMILAADVNDQVVKVFVVDAPVGTTASMQDTQTNAQEIDFKKFSKVKMKVMGGHVIWKEKVLQIDGKPVELDIADGARVR